MTARPAPAFTGVSFAPENDWHVAAPLVFPIVGQAGMSGRRADTIRTPTTAAGDTQPVIEAGPAGLTVAYALHAGSYDILVNGDHLAAWGIVPDVLRSAARANLAAWSAGAPWTEDRDGERVVLGSSTGEGWDASRILLPDTALYLQRVLGEGGARVLVGVPARHLLLAASWRLGDDEFAQLFAGFVGEYAAEADEAIDRRVFELRRGELVLFEAAPA